MSKYQMNIYNTSVNFMIYCQAFMDHILIIKKCDLEISPYTSDSLISCLQINYAQIRCDFCEIDLKVIKKTS